MRISLYACIIALIGLSSCADKSEDNSILNATIKDLNKGTVYLERLEDSTLIRIDSVAIDGQPSFSLSTSLESPEVLYVHVSVEASELIDTRIPVFMEPGIVELQTRLNSLQSAALISGSQNHQKWMEYNQSMSRYKDRNLQLIKDLIEAGKDQNDSLTAAIEAKQLQLIRTKYLATINFAKNNTEYAVAPYVVLNEVEVASANYLDTVYLALQDSVKSGTYGKALLALIEKKKAASSGQ